MASTIPTPAQRGQAVGTVESQFTATPFQNLNPSPEVFGDGGKSMDRASAGLNSFGTFMKGKAEDDDASALLDTQLSSNEFELKAIDGIYAAKGDNAAGATQRAMSDFDTYTSTVPAPATEAGKLAQKRFLFTLKRALAGKAAAHERAETYKAKTGKIAAVIGNSQNNAAIFWRDSTALNTAVGVTRAQTGNLADMNGVTDPEARELLIRTEVSATYMAAFKAAISADNAAGYAEAQKILNLTESEIKKGAFGFTAADRGIAFTMMQEGSVRGASQEASDKIMLSVNSKGEALSDEEKVARARLIKDPTTRAATVALVKDRIAEVVATTARRLTEDYKIAVDAARMGNLPVAATSAFTYYQTENLKKIVQDFKMLQADPQYQRRPDTNTALFNEYTKLTGDPTYLTKMTFAELQTKYEMGTDKEVWEGISAAWSTQNAAAGTAAATEEAALTKKARAQSYLQTDLAQLKLTFQAVTGAKPTDKAAAPQFLKWTQEFNARLEQEVSATGKEVSPLQRNAIISRMTLDKVVLDAVEPWNPIGDDTTGPSFALTESEIERLAVELDLPKKQEDVFVIAYPIILNTLRLQKTTATNDSIGNTFTSMFSTASKLAANERSTFLVQYANLTRAIQKNNGSLTEQNYLKAWKQIWVGQR